MARATKPEKVIRLLDKVWPGHPVEKQGQEHMVVCPFCGTEKNKCAVNPEKGVFQCWVCQERGPILKLLTHLYKLKVISRLDIEAVKPGSQVKLSDVIKVISPVKKADKVLWTPTVPCVFPPKTYALEWFTPHKLAEEKMHHHVLDYLYGRGLTEDDITRYRLHFCFNIGSPYHGHVFIPALGVHGRQVVYWTTRSTLPNPQPKSLHAGKKYSRYSAKNVVFNEHLIAGTTVALCEGPFDAFSIMGVVNMPAIPLLGKQFHAYHKDILLDKGIKRVYVCLDPDAKDAQAKITRSLVRVGIEPFYVDLQEGDPNDISPEKLYAAFKQAAYKMDDPLGDLCKKF
jgi:DNA primase